MHKKERVIFPLVMGMIIFFCSCQVEDKELIFDFETEILNGWQSIGDVSLETYRTKMLPDTVVGFEGTAVVNTGHDNFKKTGIITSPEFIISKKYLNFLITGNSHYNSEGTALVRIIIDGEVVKYAPPTRYPLVEWGSVDVSDYPGEKACFEIWDNSKDHFLIVDNVFQSNELILGNNEHSMIAEKRYLLFPVTKGSTQYRFRLEKEDDITEQFIVEMGDGEPDYWAFKDISLYKGKKLKLSSYCPTEVKGFDKIKQSDTVPGEELFYKEEERPQFHFTSKTGWINDPNGLVYFNGEWHLMYQHNPYGVIGSLKHWGHALSSDLIHWIERPSSVVPDDLGSNHSGGAVVDFNNSAGLQSGENKALIVFWTSAGHFTSPSSHFRQCISYSTDKGRTWNKYSDNPVIGFITGRNRDPNVIWHDQSGKWIMSLYLDGNNYAFLESDNLLDWTLTDKIEMPATECPDLFQLNMDGDPQKSKWIFWGGNGNYIIGDFNGKKFRIEGEAYRTHFGSYYAAMTFNNAPDSRIVQMGWIWDWPFHNTNFRNQLSIPNEITLRSSPNGFPVLYAYPVKELDKLRIRSYTKSNITIHKKAFIPDFEAELIDMNVIVRIRPGGILKMIMRGQEIVYNQNENTISCNGTNVKLLTDNEIREFRILADRASIEIFCNGGEKALFLPVALNKKNIGIQFLVDGTDASIKQLDIYELKSAWE
jgi:sucrose-6-phosphate hydrolase SacC (GH32 family)